MNIEQAVGLPLMAAAACFLIFGFCMPEISHNFNRKILRLKLQPR